MKALLVRHGETDYNAQGIFQGYGPIPLSQRGRRQAVEVAKRLPALQPQVLYSSDIQRAQETADIISKRLKLPVQPCEALREWHVGIWEHRSVAEFEAHLNAIQAHVVTYIPPEGESQLQTQGRMVAHMETLAKQHTDETILCVTHDKSIDMFVRWVLGLDVMHTLAYHIANASVTIFNWQNGVWTIVTLNEIRHLEALRP